MAGETATMKRAIRRVAGIVRKYAAAQGWQSGDFQIYIRANEDWGQIYIILVARAFPGKDYYDQWESVMQFLEKELKDDRPLRQALHLVLRTFDQVAEGGIYSIPESYEEVEEFLPGRPEAGA